jgi:uridine kinase
MKSPTCTDRIVVIYGPPASGKTTNGEALRLHYRCWRVLDDYRIGDNEVVHQRFGSGRWKVDAGDLILFTGHADEIRATLPGALFIPIRDALAALKGGAA